MVIHAGDTDIFRDFEDYCYMVGIDPYDKDIVTHYFLYELGREHERRHREHLLTNSERDAFIFSYALVVILILVLCLT